VGPIRAADAPHGRVSADHDSRSNRAVEDRYLSVATTDGRQLTGILLEETGAT
jgi:hypothetical protein